MHLISLDDLGADRIRSLLRGGGRAPAARGRRVVALLDFLPLGAEGFALRAAAAAAGAEVVEARRLLPGFPEGTDLLEAARVAGAYAHAVVLRHPLRGAARAAAGVSAAPVLSAGDGTGEDPLFALAELAVLAKRLDGLENRSVALCGDLARNRLVHSLAGGLVACGARVVLVPAKGAEPGEGFLDRLSRHHSFHPVRFAARSMSSLLDMVDSLLLTPDLDHQLDLFSDLLTTSDAERRRVRHQMREVRAMWVAAARDEEGEPADGGTAEGLPVRSPDGRFVATPPPPRPEEADWEARSGAEVATLARVLSAALEADPPEGPPPLPEDAYGAREGIRCVDPGCVACREPARVPPAFLVTRTDPVLLSCLYCRSRRKALYVGSRVERRFHRPTSSQVRKILPRNLVFFASKREAESAGFVSSRI